MLKIAFASFGREVPQDLRGWRLWSVQGLCAAFVIVAAVATIAMNIFSLLAGTLVIILNRPGVEFRVLKLFGRIPALGVTLPVLFAYVIWHEARTGGYWQVAWPFMANLGLALALLAIASAFSRSGKR